MPSQNQINAIIQLYNTEQFDEAEHACRGYLSTDPQSIALLNILGAILMGQERLQEAEQTFSQVIVLNPEFAGAYNNRGNARNRLEHFYEAVQDFDKAIKLKPYYAEAYNGRGFSISQLGFKQHKEAIRCFDKAILIKPDFADAYNNRGNTLKDIGEISAAKSCYEKTIQLQPNFIEAHCSLSQLTKYRADNQQIAQLENIMSLKNISDSSRAKICFALAKAYEDLDRFDESFQLLTEGNQLRKQELRYKIDDDKKLIDKIKAIFSHNELPVVNVGKSKTESIRPLFIVGMPRSGTSLVEQILSSHSSVHGGGELLAMNSCVVPVLSIFTETGSHSSNIKISDHDFIKLREHYLQTLLALNAPEKIVIDKMPLNFLFIGFILSAFPEAKIINLNRDPIATCWSCFKHYFSKTGNGFVYAMDDLTEFYRLYIELMSFWRKRYADRIYDVCYEDLTENQQQETANLLKFCQLRWEDACLDFHKAERMVKTASATQVRKKMYRGSSEAWRKYEAQLQPLIKKLASINNNAIN